MEDPQFINWIRAEWRSKFALNELLAPSLEKAELQKMKYNAKIQYLYGWHADQQFAEAPRLAEIVKAWNTTVKATSSTAIAIPMSHVEKLALGYIKQRLTVGCTFILPWELVNAVQEMGGGVDCVGWNAVVGSGMG